MKTFDSKSGVTRQEIVIQYAHCIKWTQGHSDFYPWSDYELRNENVILASEPSLITDVPDYWVELNGRTIGDGDSDLEAISIAQHFLMNKSREYAKENAQSGTKTWVFSTATGKTICGGTIPPKPCRPQTPSRSLAKSRSKP